MILDPHGKAFTAVLEMDPNQVRWFLNGKSFLRHLADLHHVKLAAYCQFCYAKGMPDDVIAGMSDDDTYVCRCAHQQRSVKRSTVRETDVLLATLGWSLRCAGDCEKRGMYDGVEGLNDPQTGVVSVKCGCTDRKYALPAGLPA